MTGHSAPRGNIPYQDALQRLKDGNRRYVENSGYIGDISKDRREDAARNGQHPYAAIVSCSDSRVIPEMIFSSGIGDIFVIRTAGNIVDDINTLGSLEYAVGHMGCNLVVVMGHTNCGAVDEAMKGFHEEHSIDIINHIKEGIGSEKDPCKASRMNVDRSVRLIKEDLHERHNVMIIGALYDTFSGEVEFFDEFILE